MPDTTRRRVVSFAPSFEAVHDVFCRDDLDVVRANKVRRVTDLCVNPFSSYLEDSAEKVVERMHHTLLGKRDEGGLGYEFTEEQTKWHNYMFQAILRNISGDSFEQIVASICRTYNWSLEKIRNHLMITSARREGKTFAVAAFCVAFMYCVANKEQNIYSPAGRPSGKLLQLVLRMLLRLPNVKGHLPVCNKESVWYQPDPDNTDDIRKLYSYPSNAKIDRECVSQLSLFFSLSLSL